jgi:hemin uptake protein HemP
MNQNRDEPNQYKTGAVPNRPAVRRTTSSELLGGEKEIIIEHDGQEYRLRITSKNKLILSK